MLPQVSWQNFNQVITLQLGNAFSSVGDGPGETGALISVLSQYPPSVLEGAAVSFGVRPTEVWLVMVMRDSEPVFMHPSGAWLNSKSGYYLWII